MLRLSTTRTALFLASAAFAAVGFLGPAQAGQAGMVEPPITAGSSGPAHFPAFIAAAAAATGAAAVQPGNASIRPFRFEATDAQLADLKRRIAATRWPTQELVSDDTQGVRLSTMQKIAVHWTAGYDWKRAEANLNQYPQFVTNVDGVEIHFIHVKSKHADALPVIITHGWPGSVIEQLKIIKPLTDPTAYGGTANDAFDVVIPSLPGYGFSGKPTELGWTPQRVAKAWATLMDRLGYKRYVAQGGDWGDAVNEQMAVQKPAGLLAIHTNMPGTLPDNISAAIAGGPAPTGLSGDEKYAWEQLDFFFKNSRRHGTARTGRDPHQYAVDRSAGSLPGAARRKRPAGQSVG